MFFLSNGRGAIVVEPMPHHQFSLALLTQFFYDGLTMYRQTLVHTAARGYFDEKKAKENYDFYEMLATNSQQKGVRGRRVGIHEVTSNSSDLASQVD